MKPIIGITSNYDSRDTVGLVTQMGADGQDWDFLASDYAAAVQEAGGIVMMPLEGDGMDYDRTTAILAATPECMEQALALFRKHL